MIGSLGDTIFEVSTRSVLTFAAATRRAPSRWAIHQALGQAPVSEFLGPSLASLSMLVRLRTSLGVDVEAELDRLATARRVGTVLQMVLGDSVIGAYVLSDYEESWVVVEGDGARPSIDVTLSLEEYGG